MANKVQFRRGNGAPPLLSSGEPAVDLSNKKVYVGTGSENICINDNQDSPVQSVNGKTGAVTISKTDIGLGNVPNAATNDQTPTYTEASSLTALSSGEKLSLSLGKLKKAVSTLISHVSGGVVNIGNASSYGHVKVINSLTQSSNLSGTALSAYQGKVLKDMIDTIGFPSKPTLTAVCPVGTVVGTSAWTGTGEFNTNASSNNAHGVYKREIDYNTTYVRFCIKLANEEEWQDWAPYYDYNGTAYEFFYSETRQLYDGVIPDESLTPQQVVDKVRWVYKRKPDIIIYGDVNLLVSKVVSSATTTYATALHPSIVRKMGDGGYRMNEEEITIDGVHDIGDMQTIFSYIGGDFTLDEVAQKNLKAKALMAMDVDGKGSVNISDINEFTLLNSGKNKFFPIDTIDNWEA